jgi:predicted ATPase
MVLVFEDLHWADSETVALLHSLVDSLPAMRALLLVNYRPEFEHGWSGRTCYTQLRIDPLGDDQSERLLAILLGDDTSLGALKSNLIERTHGNPLFLEEAVRDLAETGQLEGEPGSYRLADPGGAIRLPDTVQAILAARIDRLPAAAKQLLQRAAVIGRAFSSATWQAWSMTSTLPTGVTTKRWPHPQIRPNGRSSATCCELSY